MKMTRIKYITILIAVLIALAYIFSYVNFGYVQGLEIDDDYIDFPNGEQIQSTTGNPVNPNNPYVFIDIDGNMHRFDYINVDYKDYFDKDTNQFYDIVETMQCNGLENWFFSNQSSSGGYRKRFVLSNSRFSFYGTSNSIGLDNLFISNYAYGVLLSTAFSTTDYNFMIARHYSSNNIWFVGDLIQDYDIVQFKDFLSNNPLVISYPLRNIEIIQGRPERAYITYEEYLAEKVAEERQKFDRVTYSYDTFILSRDSSFGQQVQDDGGNTYWTGLSLLEEKNSPYGYSNPFIYPVIITGSVYAEYPERWPGDFLCVFYSDGTKDNINMTKTGSFNFTSQSNKKIVDIVLFNNNRIGGNLSNLKIALFNPAYGEGYLDGEVVGYNNGHNVGYGIGKVDGYTQGAQETLDTANVALSFFPQIFGAVGAFFVDTLGGITLFGISLWDIVITLAIVLIVGIIIKFIS